MKIVRLAILALALLDFSARAGLAQTTSAAGPKSAVATRLPHSPPRIDGNLDDSAWSAAVPIADFVQKNPIEGGQPSERTEVRIIHDDDALYIGARMYRANPRAIRRSVTRRDGDSDAEVLTISLDTYYDRRTAYSFAVTSGGVRKDFYHSTDFEDFGVEFQFDPVWLAKVRVDSLGWTAEMRIPFSQLRFTAKPEQIWGLEIKRTMPDRHEEDYWELIPKSAAGYASRFGTLRGIAGIRPSRRVELVPYVAGGLTFQPTNPLDPFNQKTQGRAGADLKMGLGSNLTLDATVNPDFGQVEADPAEVNLSAFETFFDERRPFFIEGSENLTGRGLSFLGRPTYFYSRRIGARPHGDPAGDFVDRPNNTTILGAAKVTGRLASGLTIGALASATPREWAQTYDTATGRLGRVAVEAPATFGVIRLQQEMGKQHSTLGWTLTGVGRRVDSAGGLDTVLDRQAFAGGTDWRVRFEEGKYEFTGWAGFSRVDGDAGSIARLQQASAHYFQRPDQTHLTYDPTRTSLSGYTASVRGDKNAGRYTLWGIQVSTRSPGFEINDLGQMRRADAIDFNADFQLRDTKPHRLFQYWQVGHSINGSYDFAGARQPTHLGENINLVLHSFHSINFQTIFTPRALSDEQTRGGPLMATPREWRWKLQVANQAQARLNWSSSATYANDEADGWYYQLQGAFLLRAAPRWQAQISPQYTRYVDTRQYVTTTAGGPVATFGSRYVFGAIEWGIVSTQFRLNYAFTPDLTLEAYVEPFAASGRYFNFGELPAPRSLDLRRYGTNGTSITRTADSVVVTDGTQRFPVANPDFNNLSFRSNLVLRWEWARGSTLYLIWQQNRAATTPSGNLVRLGSLWDAATAEGENFLALKISYWLSAR